MGEGGGGGYQLMEHHNKGWDIWAILWTSLLPVRTMSQLGTPKFHSFSILQPYLSEPGGALQVLSASGGPIEEKDILIVSSE